MNVAGMTSHFPETGLWEEVGSDKLGWRSLWLRGFWLQRPLGQTSWVDGAFGSEVFGYKGPWVRQVGLKEPLAQRFLVTKDLGSDKLGWRSLWLRQAGFDRAGVQRFQELGVKSWGWKMSTAWWHGGSLALWHFGMAKLGPWWHVGMVTCFLLWGKASCSYLYQGYQHFLESCLFLQWPRSSRWGTGRQDKWWATGTPLGIRSMEKV